MRIHHLNCGTMRPLGGRLVDGHGSPLRRAELVCHCLLVETDSALVLIETGMGTPAVSRPAEWLGGRFVRKVGVRTTEQETAAYHVRRLGYAIEDVRHIVLTHLDLDHAGGLVDFPHATVHVYAEELRALEAPRDERERARYRSVQFAHGPHWQRHTATGHSWYGFEAVRDLPGLPPEILLVPLAGHTRGHAGVALDTGDGWLLHAGDAYFHPGELDPVRPHCPPGLAVFEAMVQMERVARLGNQRRLRELVTRHGEEVTVVSAHNAAEFRRLSALRC